MLKFKVTINGTIVCIAGEKDLSVLSTIISAVGYLGPNSFHKFTAEGEKKITLSIGGGAGSINEEDYKDYKWLERELNIGDRIEVEFIDNSIPATPPDKVTYWMPKTLEEVNKGIENCHKSIKSCKDQIQFLEEIKEKIISEQEGK